MLISRIAAAALTLAVIAGFIFSSFAGSPEEKTMPEENVQKIIDSVYLPESFLRAASYDCMGKRKNSLEAVKAGLENAANCFELNVAFKADGTPVLAENEKYITKSSDTLEDVFKFVSEKSGNYYFIINLTGFGEFDVLKELCEEYDNYSKVYLTGVNDVPADFLYSELASFMKLYSVSDVDLTDSEKCAELASYAMSNGFTGIICDIGCMTEEFANAINDPHCGITYYVSGVESEYDIYRALSFSPYGIVASSPDVLYETMRNGGLLNR
ncbi:MAG: hypothetical protein K6F09_04590 [Clostridiales bacterium]|nr:hypothetical protein [Clostridiales bacterium]